MVCGGIVLTHDYSSYPGPTKAFREFFAGRRDPMIELSGIQAMAVKIGC
jgi:hypothetical protein